MFCTERVASAFAGIASQMIGAANSIDMLRYGEARDRLATIKTSVDCIEVTDDDPDDVPNELFVLSRIVEFFTFYNSLWRAICAGRFADSWTSLQDAMDCLRIIKRFSSDSASLFEFFEGQLPEIEKLYPYKVFASIGVMIDHCACSICGADMNGDACPHLMGELYRGKMAYGIVKSMATIEHVALVRNPQDKRCVIEIADNDLRFKAVGYLSGLLAQARLSPLRFSRTEWTKRRRLNPDYVEQARNEPCACGSGRKHKKCCLSKKYIEDHVNLIGLAQPYAWSPTG